MKTNMKRKTFIITIDDVKSVVTLKERMTFDEARAEVAKESVYSKVSDVYPVESIEQEKKWRETIRHIVKMNDESVWNDKNAMFQDDIGQKRNRFLITGKDERYVIQVSKKVYVAEFEKMILNDSDKIVNVYPESLLI